MRSPFWCAKCGEPRPARPWSPRSSSGKPSSMGKRDEWPERDQQKKALIPVRDEGMEGDRRKRPRQPLLGSTPFWPFTYFILLVDALLTWFYFFCAERNHPNSPTRHHFRPNFRSEQYGEAQEQYIKGRQHQKAVVYQNNLKAEETEAVNELRYLSYSCVCVNFGLRTHAKLSGKDWTCTYAP